MEKKKKTKKKLKFKKTMWTLSILLIIVNALLVWSLSSLNVLKKTYILAIAIVLFVVTAIFVFIYTRKLKIGFKIPFIIIGCILILGEALGIYNITKTASFVEQIVSATVNEEVYHIYVSNKVKREHKEDLDGLKLGYLSIGAENIIDAIKDLKKKNTFKSEKEYNDITSFIDDANKNNLEVLFMTSSMTDIITEEYPDFFQNYTLLDKITVSYKESIKKSDVDVTSEPFIIYLSGIDTYGTIGTVSRSDVNILAVINPNNREILLINTPRDYYVMLHSKKAYDKLTHAGIYGIDESLQTLEDLYVTDIDFYAKVNFSSLIKIVDSLGGITVNSKYSFSYDGYTFRKGTNKLDGKAALAFSRCRKELPNGDISRGENQEAVIEAIIAKIASPTIISKYTSILNTLSKSFVTNMSEEDIFKLGKFQLNENPSWNISSLNATGKDASKTTYSAGNTRLYVMVPDEQSVTDIKLKIQEMMK